MSEGSGFRSARWLAIVAGVSLAISAVLALFGDAFEVSSAGADAFSRSALGHHALFSLWRSLGHRVIVSRHKTATKLSDGAFLVVAEPHIGNDRASAEKLSDMLRASTRTLLVLPKRAGEPDAMRPGWIGRQFVRPVETAAQVLEAAGVGGKVVRPRAISAWRGDGPSPSLAEPQLVQSSALEPLVSSAEGILVGLARANARADADEGRKRAKTPQGGQRRSELIVLADPDLIATHGLGRGDNAALAVKILERLTGEADVPLVVDETLHGHEQEPSLARELLRWPLVLATLQAAFALLLLAWSALVRFGRPHRAAPALAPGKAFLIENTADLLQHGGHGGAALAAYWHAAKEHVARGIPRLARSDTTAARLAMLAGARGRAGELQALERRVAELAGREGGEELARAALAIHDFREEMTHGAE